MLQIEIRDYQTLQQILKKYPYHFYAYGSRARGTARKFSDLDICYREDIPLSVLGNLREELEESNLPFLIELVSGKHMKPQFRELISQDLILL